MLSTKNMVSVYELAGVVLVLALYTAYLGNLPTFDYRTARRGKLERLETLKRCISTLEQEIIEPCDQVESDIRQLLPMVRRRYQESKPRVRLPIPVKTRPRHEHLRLFRYTPRRKAFVRVNKSQQTTLSGNKSQRTALLDENAFDMTKLRKLNKKGVNTENDPYLNPQARHPLSSAICNQANRRYPKRLIPESFLFRD